MTEKKVQVIDPRNGRTAGHSIHQPGRHQPRRGRPKQYQPSQHRTAERIVEEFRKKAIESSFRSSTASSVNSVDSVDPVDRSQPSQSQPSQSHTSQQLQTSRVSAATKDPVASRVETIRPLASAEPERLEKQKVTYYARVSSALEAQTTSIESQRIHFENRIKANPEWSYVEGYVDNGISATKADIRPEFQRMLQDCRDHKISLILTKSISRFARSTSDCIATVRELKNYGVTVWFERENIRTDTMETIFVLISSYSFIRGGAVI